MTMKSAGAAVLCALTMVAAARRAPAEMIEKTGTFGGHILVSPGTPNGELFFEGADRIFPELLDQLLHDYKAAALTSMCLFMHVGDMDAGWRPAMERARDINLSPRLFDEIESCR